MEMYITVPHDAHLIKYIVEPEFIFYLFNDTLIKFQELNLGGK